MPLNKETKTNTNDLPALIWFQVFLSNTNNSFPII